MNLKISVTARLLNPAVWVVTQSTDEVHEDTLSTLGEQVHIIDPFQTYAKYLGATIHNPAVHTLNQWLAGTRTPPSTRCCRRPRAPGSSAASAAWGIGSANPWRPRGSARS